MSDTPAAAAAESSERAMEIGQQLEDHGIEIQAAPAPHLYDATPSSLFSTRRVRYTVGFGYRRITRETNLERLSTELGEFIGRKKGNLVGIDGINGFRCGPTEDELRSFCHDLDADDESPILLRDTHLPSIAPARPQGLQPGGGWLKAADPFSLE